MSILHFLAVTANDDEYLNFMKNKGGGQEFFFNKKEKTSQKRKLKKIMDNENILGNQENSHLITS